MRRYKRNVEIFNMSFLDVISCGFGAIILLLVISLAFEPTNIKTVSKDLQGLIKEKIETRKALVKNNQLLRRDLSLKIKNLTNLTAHLAALNFQWENIQKKYGSPTAKAKDRIKIEEQLKVVRQKLSEEMKRLLSQPDYKPPSEDANIGGIPVDSEYIIFIIDTSGSMKRGAWSLVISKIKEILSVYPKVKGIQVINDMGAYMFRTYKGQWIPDTPGLRRTVIKRLSTWSSFSNSSPVEGILHAIRTFYHPNRRTSIYVFGDDFNGTSIDEVIRTVSRINRKNPAGQSQVRIHTFGFPVYILRPERLMRFAHMMRLLAEKNSGSFVGVVSSRIIKIKGMPN